MLTYSACTLLSYSQQQRSNAPDPLPGQPPFAALNRNALMPNAIRICRPTYVLVPLLMWAIGWSQSAGKDGAPLLAQAADLLDTISHNPHNSIPDAVLNRTRCITVIPFLAGGNAAIRADGLASCREAPDRWGTPFVINFSGRLPRAQRANLVVFVLSETGARTLQSAELHVGQRVPAPLASTNPVTTQADLSGDSLSYQHAAGKLSSSSAKGSLRLAAGDRGTLPKKAAEGFLSSVTSLFNSIIPMGIVIHHTAVIPTNNGLAINERDVDNFHQARGFGISCLGRVYHIAYHYLILPDGTVKPGRPERCEGAHAEGYNSYLGISVVGDFSRKDNPRGKNGPSSPTDRQINSLVQLCRRLRDRYNIPLQHIVRHSDISSTDCPGSRFPFRYVLQQLEQPGLAARPQR